MYITRKIALQLQIARLERRIIEKERSNNWYRASALRKKIKLKRVYNIGTDIEKLKLLHTKLELLG